MIFNFLVHMRIRYKHYGGANDEAVKFVTKGENRDKTMVDLLIYFRFVVEERCFSEFYAYKIQFNGHGPLK